MRFIFQTLLRSKKRITNNLRKRVHKVKKSYSYNALDSSELLTLMLLLQSLNHNLFERILYMSGNQILCELLIGKHISCFYYGKYYYMFILSTIFHMKCLLYAYYILNKWVRKSSLALFSCYPMVIFINIIHDWCSYISQFAYKLNL